MNLRGTTIILLFVVSFGIIAGVTFKYLSTVNKEKSVHELVNNTYANIKTAEDLFNDLVNAQSTTRGFLITGRQEFLKPYYISRQRMIDKVAGLKSLVKDSVALSYTDSIGHYITLCITYVDKKIQLLERGKREVVVDELKSGEGLVLVNQAEQFVSLFIERLQILLLQREQDREEAGSRTLTMFLTGCAVAMGLFVILFFLVYSENIKRQKSEEKLKMLNVLLESKVRERTALLTERVKELDLLNYTSELLFNEQSNLEEVFVGIVSQIPSAWQYPEYTQARITFNAQEYSTPGYLETPWFQRAEIKTRVGKRGIIDVSYKKELPKSDEGPFLKEERKLLNSLAEMLQNYLDKKEAEHELQKTLHGLELLVSQRTNELRITNDELSEAHKSITDSINYAQRIQQTLLPSVNEFNDLFKDAFVFYRPKDVVSGDFYWMKQIEELVFIACVDCTGHGVPGALLSVLGNQLLENTIIDRRVKRPDTVLEEMHKSILRLFARHESDFKIPDGMELSLCVIDREAKQISFSGAGGYTFVFKGEDLITMTPGRHSLGGLFSPETTHFHYWSAPYEGDEILYMTTDGFCDQFGGEKGKKFGKRNFITLLRDIKHESMPRQQELIKRTFETWKGREKQIDDVTVIGIKL